MFRLFCKYFGHKWGRWHDAVYDGEIRCCLNCHEIEHREKKNAKDNN